TDITSKHYQAVLMKEVEKQIVQKGLDGVFLDTVGNIDNEHADQPVVLEQQRIGMKNFLKSLKKKHASLSLIQNWGFGTLKYRTYPYVDGIMWENFNYSTVANDQWSKDRMTDLQKLNQSQDIKTLTISSVQGTKSETLAQKNGFLHMKSNIDLNYNKF
ncbi:putative glycoside hydrolase, partial [Exiguobacterium sp.]